ncbi:unnamed protein product [Hymenolepis diminuta]|uniref:Transposase n=1 Tax=Hymenolepis diminuta TaxID=6216 RepID=A0A0R3SIK1_HYMDI|nr:unnamed protein product [Hymenolepis diminuta]
MSVKSEQAGFGARPFDYIFENFIEGRVLTAVKFNHALTHLVTLDKCCLEQLPIPSPASYYDGCEVRLGLGTYLCGLTHTKPRL